MARHPGPSPPTGTTERLANVLRTCPVLLGPSTEPSGALEMLPLVLQRVSKKLSPVFQIDSLPRFKLGN